MYNTSIFRRNYSTTLGPRTSVSVIAERVFKAACVGLLLQIRWPRSCVLIPHPDSLFAFTIAGFSPLPFLMVLVYFKGNIE